MKKTKRGFNVYSEFKDTHGSVITVQESSAASEKCVWIFLDGARGRGSTFFDEVTGKYHAVSPHLNKVKAKQLIKALTKFVED